VKLDASFVPLTSPDFTSELLDVFLASTEVRPDDTTPVTCPPTAAPDFPFPDWLVVFRLLPCWTFVPVEFVTSARAGPETTSALTRTMTAAINDRGARIPYLLRTNGEINL
jgi:hypothetical protein